MTFRQIEILFLPVLTILVFALPSYCAQKREWRLEQINRMRGKTTVYFTLDRVKVVTSSNRAIVAGAPDWKVHTFRTDDKVISHVSPEQFFESLRSQGQRFSKDFRPIASEQVFGVKAEIYKRNGETLAVWHLPGVAQEVLDVIAKYYKEQRLDGVLLSAAMPQKKVNAPIRVLASFEDSVGSKGVSLVSLKEVPYKAADFAVPSGYRIVPNDLGISFSSEKKKEAELLLQDIGVGIELGKSPQKETK